MSTFARFYVEDIPASGSLTLPSEIKRHMKALRIQEGTIIGLFDGKHEYQARYQGASVDILQKSEPKDVSGAQITLAIAFPKGSRLDWLIEKATELGVHAIIPLITKRTIVQPRDTKVERLRKLAIAACEQCGRTTIPSILEPVPVDKLVIDVNHFDAAFIFSQCGVFVDEPSIRNQARKKKNILLVVGPEGGLTDQEEKHFADQGALPVSLGTLTLRTETAGIAALTLIKAFAT